MQTGTPHAGTRRDTQDRGEERGGGGRSGEGVRQGGEAAGEAGEARLFPVWGGKKKSRRSGASFRRLNMRYCQPGGLSVRHPSLVRPIDQVTRADHPTDTRGFCHWVQPPSMIQIDQKKAPPVVGEASSLGLGKCATASRGA